MGRAQRAVVRTSRAVRTAGARRCEHCGSLLHGKGTQFYCTAKCRAMAYRARKTETVRVIVGRLKDDIAELEEFVRQ